VAAEKESEAPLINNAPIDKPLPLPAPIVAALSRLIRRTRHLVIIRGLCASCAAGIGAFLLIILLDASITLLSPWTRWIMSALAYLTWASTTFWFLIRPLTITFTLTGIARLIEIHHPELQERISSAVQLLSSRDIPSIRGSETLIAALTEEAVHEVGTIHPRQEISFRSAMPFAIAATGVIAVLFILWLTWPQQTGFLLARATAPFLNLPNVQAIDLVVEPGDTLVAAGSSLQVSVRSAHTAVTSARLRQVDRNGYETLTDMVALTTSTNQPGRRFAITLPNVLNEFRYRVHAGDALSQYFTVRVAIPPVIEHLDIEYRYPEYSRLGVKQERDGSGTIRALVGTTVTLSAQVNKPARLATLLIITPVVTNSLSGNLRMVGKNYFYDFTLTIPKGLNGGWTLKLSDEINLTNTPFEHPIQAIPDNPPVVTVTSPLQRELRLNRNTRLPVTYRAEDDHGLTAAAIVFTLPGLTNTQIRSLPTPTAPTESSTRIIDGETLIMLGDSFFTNAPRVGFRIRAFDNLPGTAQGPQSSDSETITIILDNQADTWIEQVLTSQDQRIQEGLKQVQKKLAFAREQARALDKPLSQQQTPLSDSTTRQIDSLQDTLAATDNALRSLATDIDKGFFETLSSNLTVLAENHVGKAENMAGQIRLVDTPTERMAINSNITDEITVSQDILEHAIQEHELARAAVHRAVELDQLANQQAALAQTRQEMEKNPPLPSTNGATTAQTTAPAKEWQQAQDKVADELAKMARETPGSTAQIAATLSNLSAQAATQVGVLGQRQNDLARLTKEEADRLQKMDSQWHELATRQNQLADLARSEPLATPQNEAMRNAARDLESGKKQQAVETQANVYDALKQAADMLHQSAFTQPSVEQQAARQAQAAGQLAQQAAKNAEEAVESAQEAMQQAEQQVAMTEQNSTHQNKDEAQAVAQQVKQSLQSAEQQMQKAQEAAQDAQPTAEKKPKPAAIAIAKAVEATEAALEASKFATQAHQQANSLKLAELVRQQVELRKDATQNEAILNAARDLESGKKNQQAHTPPPTDDALPKAKAATQQAAQQARDADLLAQQAAENAGEAVESARQATQQAEQQAVTATQATEKSQQAADQVSQLAKQSQGKANEQDLNRAAEASLKKAVAAQQNEAEAQDAAQQAKQATQDAEKQLQKAQQAAQSARQAAQQAAEQNQKAASATSTPLEEQEKAETAKAVATANAVTATEAALEAGKLAAKARRQADVSKLAELARQQVELRKNAAQNEAMRDIARDLESGKKNPESPENNKPEESQTKTSAQKAAQQAENANLLAQQAALKAEQAVEHARQASQQAEQQAAEAKQNQAEAQDAARQAKQSLQAAEQQAQKARQANQAAQQASQQAAEQAQKADSATSIKIVAQAKAATDKAAINATTNAVAATEAALSASKFATQAQQQANAFKLAELARQQVAQDQVSAKNEALQKAARNLESGMSQPMANTSPSATQQAERQAQEAGMLAQQAAQNAEKSVEKARQAAQQAEQQATTAKQTKENSAQISQHASQLAQGAKGKANEQELTRAAETARQKSFAAQQNEAEAQDAAQKAKQAAQATDQQAQKAKQATQAAQQAAQQASEQAQKAASATSPPAAEQAKVETSKAAATAIANAVVATEAAFSASKSAAQARQQSDTFKLAEIGRKQAELRQKNSQSESERNVAHDLEAGKEPQFPAQAGPDTGKPTPAQEIVNRATGLKADQQGTHTPKPDASLSQIKTAAQQAARQAQEANTLAQQAAQNARQAAERASQAAQQTGPSEQTQQSMQTATQQAQRAQQTATAAQQAAQRAAEHAQKAASAGSSRAAQQALSETSKANAAATANAVMAAEAAFQASESATRTRQQADAFKLDDLAKHQDELRRDAANLLTEKQTASDALRATLSRQIADQQRELAEATSTLAQELDKEATPAQATTQAAHAAEATQQVNVEMQKNGIPNAEAAATQARQAMAQLSDTLHTEAVTTDPNQLEKRAKFSQLAQRVDNFSKQQEQLSQLMGDIAANQPLEALQTQQRFLGAEAQKMAQDTTGLHEQAQDILAQSPLSAQTAQAAHELTQAAKAATQAAKQMPEATGRDNEPGSSSSQAQQQAANQTRQNQQSAAQSLQQASAKLQQAASATGSPSPAPAAPNQLTPSEPESQAAIAQAYQAAKQASQNPQTAEADQAAAQVAQAARVAATAAQAKGANPHPATLQTASSNGGSAAQDSQSTEGVPSFARRMGLKLQDWLRLHGELKDDVLQAANNEGPEEYRPMIQRYFREVSSHKEEE